jgi:competence protein ComEC
MGGGAAFRQIGEAIEHWLEAERAQLPLWLPVALGGGITAWFLLPDAARWVGFLLVSAAVALLGLALPERLGRSLLIGGLAMAVGCGLIWWRAESVAAPVLARPAVVEMTGRVVRVERLPARELVRVTLLPGRSDLPPKVRVNLPIKDVPAGLARDAVLKLRARLMPPAGAAVPGGYDFARSAWFFGLGATGKGFTPIEIVTPARAPGADLRASLSAHIQARVAGSAGGIASALATGDQGAIANEDVEAMQRSGLAHLLSVSGLHVTAVTAAAMLLVLKLLALSPTLALRWRLPLVAAGAGALAAIGYTWLTGAEVPTIRSCVAALLVLLALSLGREAITLRLVATGAVIVLLLWPEALAGASFQLSFAAVTAIVALHESPRMERWFGKREEGRWAKLGRELGSLLLTGVAVELALMPIGMFHFHQAGLYGALANIVAIPLTTFVIMPLEALALLLDTIGLGAPAWWLTDQALELLLWIARITAAAPGAVAALPTMPAGAFALMMAGGLWLALWRTGIRFAGALPLVIGLAWMLATPAPDLIVTGDGRHLAIRMPDGSMALLRDRAGDYTRDMLAETGGSDVEPVALSDQPGARCSADVCMIEHRAGNRVWRVAATRSGYTLPWAEFVALCRSVDVMISDRRLSAGCTPRWLKLDRPALAKTGGVAISFRNARVTMVRGNGKHPWLNPSTVQPPYVPEQPIAPVRTRNRWRSAAAGGFIGP